MERVTKFRYLGITVSQDLTWSHHLRSVMKKANLRRLRDFKLPRRVLKNFYIHTVESILSENITTWMGNTTKQEKLALRRMVRSAERFIKAFLSNLHIYTKHPYLLYSPPHTHIYIYTHKYIYTCLTHTQQRTALGETCCYHSGEWL